MDPNIYAMVLDTLHRATSQDAEILKPAEKKLQEWEVEPGFYSVLLDILTNHSISVNVRWLSVMCFKNGVDRYWRKNAPNAITEEEKHKLRQGLLTENMLSEPVTQIATQQAVLISKIARFDCPLHWSNLVPDLLGALKAPQSLVQQRALLIFHHVVKALASKRLACDRRTFMELTASVYPYMLGLWHAHTQAFLARIQQAAATELITEHLEKALLCLRILRKLTVFGFKKPHESQDAAAFLNVVFDRAKTSLECRKLLKGRGIYPLELCEKFIIHLTKVALGVLGMHPISYIPLIKPSLEFTLYFCFTDEGVALAYERFTIQCLNIFKGILQCAEYKNSAAVAGAGAGAGAAAAAQQAKLAVLSAGSVRAVGRRLVASYLPLSADALALWDAEPESFATDEAGEAWKYSMRPCTEAVFMELFHGFRETLAPELAHLLALTRQARAPPAELAAVLQRDAVYTAVGLAAFDLYDDVDFDEWFTNVLSQELKVKDDNYRIIRRRVCQLIGQWCGVRASVSLRPAMYGALLGVLADRTEDVAVKLAAAEALRCTIDDFEFDLEQFVPFAQHVLSALYDLLVESEECDTKMHVLHVLSFVIERCGASACGQQAAPLLEYLPQLWLHAAGHSLLGAAVLATQVHLLKALGACGGGVRRWMLRVVEESTRLAEPAHVYLLEDALELWLAILETAHEADLPLLELAQNLPPILEQSSEHLRIVMYIMEGYTLLAPEPFAAGRGGACLAAAAAALPDLRPKGQLTVLKMAEVCISVSYPERNMYLGVKVIWPIIIKVIHCLLEGGDLPMVLSVQLSLLARVVLLSAPLFYAALEEAARALPGSDGDPARLLDSLLLVWTDKMNLLTQVKRLKIVGLGLAALLTTQNTTVLHRFPAILKNIIEVLNDVMKIDEAGVYVDGLLSAGSSPPSPLAGREAAARWGGSGGGGGESAHEARRRALQAQQPAHRLDLRLAVTHQLETLKNQVGPEAFERLIQSADQETLQAMRSYITM